MSMGVSIVSYAVDPENAEALHGNIREYLVPAAQQTRGYRGFLLVDQGGGKRLALLLFDSVEDAQSAQGALTPVGREHTYALMAGPAQGSLGTIVIGDGVFAQPIKSQQP